jgi:hypothetical protein
MYIDRRYRGAKLLEKIVPMLVCQPAKEGEVRLDPRSSCGVPDQLVEADSCTSLEVTLSVVSNPGNIEAGSNVETHGNDEKGKVPPTNGRNSGEQNVS